MGGEIVIARSFTAMLAFCLGCALALPAGDARAETIHLKNGAQVQGKIVKEDAKTFSIETPDGRRKINKDDVAVRPSPDPIVAAVVGIVPGAGLVYTGDYGRGAFFFGTSGLVGAAAYFAARQIRPTSPSTAAVSAIAGAEIVALLGAWEAYNHAVSQGTQTRYKIDYD